MRGDRVRMGISTSLGSSLLVCINCVKGTVRQNYSAKLSMSSRVLLSSCSFLENDTKQTHVQLPCLTQQIHISTCPKESPNGSMVCASVFSSKKELQSTAMCCRAVSKCTSDLIRLWCWDTRDQCGLVRKFCEFFEKATYPDEMC